MLPCPVVASGDAERRQGERIALELEVELEGTRAVTRDISASGVFIATRLALTACSEVRFALLMSVADPVGPLRLECQGHIMHAEPEGDAEGIGVAITSYLLRPAARGGG